MAFLIDSDVLIAALLGVPEAQTLLDELAESRYAISVISYMEAYQGALHRSALSREALSAFEAIAAALPVIPVSLEIARRCAELRESLRRQGGVGSRALDLLIAATALENGLTVVTRNVDDYRGIPNLSVYRFS